MITVEASFKIKLSKQEKYKVTFFRVLGKMLTDN